MAVDDYLMDTTAKRLEALEYYAILGTPPEPAFDRIVTMVAALFGSTSVHINFLDDCVQWSKAFYGTDASGVGLADSFCAHAIRQDEVFVVLDARRDPRFGDNPLVTGDPEIRFYAGAVLRSSSGTNIGTLCLVDPQPKAAFGERERTLLQNFAAIVMDELELRSSLRALEQAQADLARAHTALAEQMAQLERTSLALKHVNAQLKYDASHDTLTGLPNRARLLELLQGALEASANPFALLFLDFDRFKLINDSLGHTIGDEVLRALSLRLRYGLKEGDTLARFGGDEFCVLLPDTSPDAAREVAERLRRHFCHPVRLGKRKLQLGVSIGVVSSAGGYRRAEDMLQDADIAMYGAKEAGKKSDRGAVVLFEAAMREGVVARLSLEDELRTALEQNGLRVYYQPIFSAAGEPLGVEALARWPHPERGFIAPATFIPVAEDAGLILPLERFVLTEAVGQAARWNQGASLSLSVNLSSSHFGRPDLVDFIETLLLGSGLKPAQLTLELTESTLLEHSDTLSRNMHGLKALGVKLALDDFGTGYSSLSYLQRVPLDILKLDRSFVAQLDSSPQGTELVKTILAMARALGLEVVAEGVETEAQREALRALGCPYLQGFLFAKPLPSAEVASLLPRKASETLEASYLG